ncbi:hypothetical protein F0U61_06455 [Archangium violaceum]|uniref:hypothetical protein n=1 Tax=Archangium violaceum TaxID=83451 RepID=UPI002B2D07F5|nr:hypothetical protein F0U61_06455 [Archangium violaceum]
MKNEGREDTVLVYSLKDRWPGVPDAFGATRGQQHIAPLLSELHGAPSGEIVIYDFEGIEHTTASYINATVFRLLRASGRAIEEASVSVTSGGADSGEALDIFLLVANLSEDVAEELQTVLKSHNAVCLEATKWDGNGIAQARVRGVLDGVLRDTLVRVVTNRNATATMLAEREPPNVTGWNNRLMELYRRRLVTRIKEGRQYIYSSLCSEVILG